MLRKQLLIFCLLCIVPQVWACGEDHARLRHKAISFIDAGQYDSARVCANDLLRLAVDDNDSACEAKSHVLLWYAATETGRDTDACQHLEQALRNTSPALAESDTLHEEALARDYEAVVHQKNIQLAGASVLSLVLLLGLFYALSRTRSGAQPSLAHLPKDDSPSGRVATTRSFSDQKRDELVVRLEQLMTEQHLYREKLLTRDKVAELLETNRTYLGQVMSEVFQKSFTQYINDLRIDEAIRILDNPDSKRPIRLIGQDLGFNSVTTFNTQFQSRTGMTPAQYRQQVALSKAESDEDAADEAGA